MQECDLAWLAGIIDGEGTVRLYRCKEKRRNVNYIKPDLRIANTNPDIITAAASIMRDIVGDYALGAIRIHAYQDKPDRKVYYHIQVCRRSEISKILAAIIPHLRGKKAQAEIVHEWCRQRLAKQPTKGGIMQPQDGDDDKLLADLHASLGK